MIEVLANIGIAITPLALLAGVVVSARHSERRSVMLARHERERRLQK